MSERPSPAKAGLWAVGALTLVAVGTALGAAWTSPAVPVPLRSPSPVTSFPVQSATFDDVRSVRLEVSRGEESALTSPGSGLVTRFDCRPGTTLESGTAPLWLDDAPVVVLATTLPLWRDLPVGAQGNDVRALQEELTRLGHTVEVTGTLGTKTLRAVKDLLDGLGDPTPLTSVSRERFLWIPAPSVVVAGCSVSTGGPLEAGAEIVTTPGTLTSVALRDDAPSDLVAGARTLRVDGIDVAIEPQSPITDPGLLSQLDAAPSLQQVGTGDEAPVGQLRLAQPVDVSVVPPSAVLTAPDGTTCVTTDGVPHPLRVVGSELGQTFVLFDDAPPTAVDTSPRRDAPCA